MVLRSAAFASTVALMTLFAAPAGAETTRCEATSMRVYFAQASSQLSPAALETLDIAARNVAGCDYAELRVAIDASSPQAQGRAEAIRAAAYERNWDAVRFAPVLRAAAPASPDYAEVTLTPEAAPTMSASLPQVQHRPEAGV